LLPRGSPRFVVTVFSPLKARVESFKELCSLLGCFSFSSPFRRPPSILSVYSFSRHLKVSICLPMVRVFGLVIVFTFPPQFSQAAFRTFSFRVPTGHVRFASKTSALPPSRNFATSSFRHFEDFVNPSHRSLEFSNVVQLRAFIFFRKCGFLGRSVRKCYAVVFD